MASTEDGDTTVTTVVNSAIPSAKGRNSNNAEDDSASKDRARTGVAQTRQTLGAVGRVASRVRTSGLLKVSALLPKAREENEEVNSSPWGAGTAAIARSQSVSVIAENFVKLRSGATGNSEAKRKPDLLDVTSPLSVDDSCDNRMIDEQKLRTVNNRYPRKTWDADKAALETNTIHRKKTVDADRVTVANCLARKKIVDTDQLKPPTFSRPYSPRKNSERVKGIEAGRPLEKLVSSVVRPKFTFRPSLLVEATSPRDNNGKRKASRNALFKKSSSEGRKAQLSNVNGATNNDNEVTGINEKDMSISSPLIAITDNNSDDVSASKATAVSAISPPQASSTSTNEFHEVEQTMKFLNFPSFARGKSKHEGKNRKSKAGLLTRGKSKSAGYNTEAEQARGDAGSSHQKNGTGMHRGEEEQSREKNGAPKTRRSLWKDFLNGDFGGDRGKRDAKGKGKRSKEKETRMAVGPDFFAKAAANKKTNILQASRTDHIVSKIKSPKGFGSWTKSHEDIQIVEGDDILESDDEEKANESVVRSMAVDDFISYQTRHKAKKPSQK